MEVLNVFNFDFQVQVCEFVSEILSIFTFIDFHAFLVETTHYICKYTEYYILCHLQVD